MICSSLNRFFTSNLPPGLDSKPLRYSKAGGRRRDVRLVRPLVENSVHEIRALVGMQCLRRRPTFAIVWRVRGM
jgi:hypothetical protein